MSSIINASTTSGLVSSADLSGTIELQANGVTKLTVDSTGAKLPNGLTVAGNGPAFSAVTGFSTSASNATTTVFVSYNTPLFDTASAFNTTTGKFQPTVAGYYQINAKADFGNSGIGAASTVVAAILKNGTTYSFSGFATYGNSFSCAGVSDLVYLNGTTDYVQAGVYQNTGGTVGSIKSFFSGSMVRSA